MSSPIRKTSRFTVESQKMTAASVSCLLLLRCPSAVFFGVAKRIIYAINSVSWGWPRSHVSIKRLERFPFVADSDSPSTVSIVGCILGTAATVVHAVKCSVFGSSTHTVRCIVALGRIGIAHQKNLLLRFGWWEGPGWSYNLLLGPCYFSTPVIREQR